MTKNKHLVDVTEPICQEIDAARSDMAVFDSSGIEAFVQENNPKYADQMIRQLKAYAKAMHYNKSYDPYKAAYSHMPSHAASSPDVKQLFINGHFCYVFKFGLITNGLGIVRHIEMYNKDYFAAHPGITVGSKTDSPDEDKSVHDARLLIPTLSDFFKKHPLINPHTFLGDSAFDSALLYRQLLTGDTFGSGRHFDRAYIPLNKRSSIASEDHVLDPSGIPCCPHDDSLTMKYECSDIKPNGLKRYKFVCPKMKQVFMTVPQEKSIASASVMTHAPRPDAAG